MDKPKSIDRHLEPEMVVIPLRMEKESHYERATRISKRKDRTRAYILRQALTIGLKAMENK